MLAGTIGTQETASLFASKIVFFRGIATVGKEKEMLIPMCWTAIVCLLTGMAVYCNCQDASEEQAVFFIAILATAFTFCTLIMCIACGM